MKKIIIKIYKIMADVIRKGFKDKNDNKVRFEGVPDESKADKVKNATAGNFAKLGAGGNIEDSGKNENDFAPVSHEHIVEYADTYADFAQSDVLQTLLAAGISHILYTPTTSNPATNHVLFVRHYSGRPSPRVQVVKHFVEQCLIDRDGIKRRSRAFDDAEHTEPYSDWTDWKELTPEVSSNITEGDMNPVSGGAVYEALLGVNKDLISGKPNSYDPDNSSHGTIKLNGGVHEGWKTGAVGDASHAEGDKTVAAGDNSHAEGYVEQDSSRDRIENLIVVMNPTVNTVIDYTKIAFRPGTYDVPIESFASVGDVVFYKDVETGDISYGKIQSISALPGEADMYVYQLSHEVKVNVTEDPNSKVLFKAHLGAFGNNSHVEGFETLAKGNSSHAEGAETIAEGNHSHAEGCGTIAKGANQHVCGKYNVADNNGDYAFIVGNGTDGDHRSNALGIKWNGDAAGAAIKSSIPASGDNNKIPTVGAVRAAVAAVDASANGLIRSLYFVIPSGSTNSPSRLADWVDSTHKVFDYALELPASGSVTVKAIGGCYAYGGPGYEDTDQGEVNVTKVIANSPSPVAGQRVSWNIYDELIAAGNTAYGSVDYVKDIVICVEISEALQSDKMFVLSVLPCIDSEA